MAKNKQTPKTEAAVETAAEAQKPAGPPASDMAIENAALHADLEAASQANADLHAENEALIESNSTLTEANLELLGRIEPLTDNLEQTKTERDAAIEEADSLKQSIEQSNLEVAKMNQTLLALEAELDAAKMESLPQLINLDRLAAAAFGRSPQCSPKNAAKLACELHNEIIARCAELANGPKVQGADNGEQE